MPEDRKEKMRVYLDNCCYNRPFDDRSNIKNYLEREATLIIMQKAFDGEIGIVGSEVLQIEMLMIQDDEKRYNVNELYKALAGSEIKLDEKIRKRAETIQTEVNIKAFDSLHLASAEMGADVLLTTDVKFAKACRKLNLRISVQNPIEYVMEVTGHDTDN